MDELFDATPYNVALDPDTLDGLGADARRTYWQRETLVSGMHPVTRRPLHRDAPSPDDRHAPGPRCRDCAHLIRNHIPSGKTYLKCSTIPITGGPRTDLRAWWPACAGWKPTNDDGDQR